MRWEVLVDRFITVLPTLR